MKRYLFTYTLSSGTKTHSTDSAKLAKGLFEFARKRGRTPCSVKDTKLGAVVLDDAMTPQQRAAMLERVR